MYGYEVSKVAVYQGRFIVGRTHSTLLLVRVRCCRTSAQSRQQPLLAHNTGVRAAAVNPGSPRVLVLPNTRATWRPAG